MSSFDLNPPKLSRYRVAMILSVTLVTGVYLLLELTEVAEKYLLIYYVQIHLVFSLFIWLSGIIGIQYGYRKISAASDALMAERNSLLAIFDSVLRPKRRRFRNRGAARRPK